MTIETFKTATTWLAGNGTNKVWPFSEIRYDDAGDLVVDVRAVDGTITSTGANLSVAQISDTAGNVTYPVSGAALPAGASLRVRRQVAFTQPRRIGNQGAFFPEIHETAFDRLTMLVQQLNAVDVTILSEQANITGVLLPAALALLTEAIADAEAAVEDSEAAAAAAIAAAASAVGAIVPGMVPSSLFAATSAGLSAAEMLAATGAAVNTRWDSGKKLLVDRAHDMTASVNPRTQVQVMPSGRLRRVGTANMTFFNTFEAGRHQVFENWPAVNLSFLRGTDQFPEWHDSPANIAADARTTIQKALDSTNFSKVLLDGVNHKLSAHVNINRNYGGLIGKGEVVTNLELTDPAGATTAIQINPAGNDASRLTRIELQDFTITRSAGIAGTGGYGIASYWNQGLFAADVQIDDTLGGVYLKRNGSADLHRIAHNFEGTANNVVGFEWDGNGGGAGALGNASTMLVDCAASSGAGATGTGSIGWKCFGEYVGDLGSYNFNTQRRAIGISTDLSTATPNTNGNADIIHITPKLDGFSTAGYYQAGNTDNLVMTTVALGWINPKDGAPSSVGILGASTRGLLSIGNQFGLGGKTSQAAILWQNSKDMHSVADRIVDWKKVATIDASTDCSLLDTFIYTSGNPAAPEGIDITGASKRIHVRPRFGTGTKLGYGVRVGAAAEDCSVEIHPTDMTNITAAQLVIDLGTRTRIRYDGPATNLSLLGTDTYLWCDPTPYVPTVGTAGGTLNSARWSQTGKRVDADILWTAGATAPGVPLTFTAPRAAKAGTLCTGGGRNATTGAQLQVVISGSTINVFSPTNGAPGVAGNQIAVTISYEAA